MCPGGEERALDIIMPLLNKVAAKDAQGNPCVGKAGTGGSGHYVKMIHNGIEHGMMSALAEAWQIMNLGLRMTYDEIGNEFERWNEKGELVSQVIGSYLFLHLLLFSMMPLSFHQRKPCSCPCLLDGSPIYAIEA